MLSALRLAAQSTRFCLRQLTDEYYSHSKLKRYFVNLNFPLLKQPALILALFIVTSTVWGQVTVTGSVLYQSDNSHLPGVSVVEKGTQNGTATQRDGTFSLEVSGPHAILEISFIGMITQEYALKGQRQVLIKLKPDCHKDFFDSQKIKLYANSGLIHNPWGGQIEIASPYLRGGAIKGLFSYQTGENANRLINGQIELSHFVSNCDYDMDFRWHYRQVAFRNDLKTQAYSLEADLNLGNIKLITGYSHLAFQRIETLENESSSGVLIGIGTYLGGRPLYPTVLGKVAFYQGRVEYQASILGGYKRFLCFVRFYKLNSFHEVSAGIGTQFTYWLKKQRRPDRF